jgi:hypothetical protein
VVPPSGFEVEPVSPRVFSSLINSRRIVSTSGTGGSTVAAMSRLNRWADNSSIEKGASRSFHIANAVLALMPFERNQQDESIDCSSTQANFLQLDEWCA